LKILYIKNENSKIENDNALYFENLLLKAKIEVITISIQNKGIISSLENIVKIRKAIKENDIHLIHCFNCYVGLLVFLGVNKKKIVLSFFEKEIEESNLFKKIKNLKTKLTTRFFFHQVILESQKCATFLSKNSNCYFLPEKLNIEEFFPLDSVYNKENMNLNLTMTYILYVGNSDLEVENFSLVNNAILSFKSNNLNLKVFNYEASHLKNQYFNSADIVITSLNPKSIKQITEEILLTNTKLISLENNDQLEMYAQIDNLHFCPKSSLDIHQKIKSLLVTSNQNSRDEIIQINEGKILSRLLFIYKMNYLWGNSRR
jgi:hypothetical protein